MRLFTLWISAGKWLFLLWPNFGPLNCLDCINKHLETSLHIPMDLPGPKKNQFWSIGTVFSPINGHIQRWKLPKKWDYRLFSQFLPPFWAQWTSKPVKTNQCIKIPYWGYLKHHFGSFGTDFIPENGHFENPISWAVFSVGYMTIYRAKNCSN